MLPGWPGLKYILENRAEGKQGKNKQRDFYFLATQCCGGKFVEAMGPIAVLDCSVSIKALSYGTTQVRTPNELKMETVHDDVEAYLTFLDNLYPTAAAGDQGEGPPESRH